MNKPILREHNLTTGEIIDREMTDAEFKLYEIQLKESATPVA